MKFALILLLACLSAACAHRTPRVESPSLATFTLSALEPGVVLLDVMYDDPDYPDRTERGAGLVAGISEDRLFLLTALHVVSPTDDIKRLIASFASAPPLDLRTAQLEAFGDSWVQDVGDELALIALPLSPGKAAALMSTTPRIPIASASQALDPSAEVHLIGRCRHTTLQTFAMTRLKQNDAVPSRASLTSDEIVPGCSGSVVVVGRSVAGVVQNTDGLTATVSLIDPTLVRMRGKAPLAADQRNWIEPFGVLSFAAFPSNATLATNGRPAAPLRRETALPTGSVNLALAWPRALDVASTNIEVNANQRVECEVEFATRVTRWRQRYGFWLMGASAAVAMVGGGLLLGARNAQQDFGDSWQRADRDRNHAYFYSGVSLIASGVVALAGATTFALGERRSSSELFCR